MSMISSALITGGNFTQSVQQHISTQKSAIDRLQEAVAHTAFHNSGERFDPPKCHPNTRVAVRDKIEKWALRMDPDTKDASILWLSGAAGAGKSAIAQTVAEDFHSRGLLVASFFFGRSDGTRNHARSLVATIAYQLYSLLPPPDQGRILAVVDRDPLIFTKSLLAQYEALIAVPFQPLFESGFGSSIDTPRLIIIDGLDECLDHGMQRNVLLMFCASVHRFHLPFVFLLVSRPEVDIQSIFNSLDFLPIHTRLFLDDTYLPDRDIELFLRNEFQECRTSHPFRHLIPHDWPSAVIVNEIIRKSSGQFIYASVVAKYLKSPRHRPDYRLDIVLKLRPVSRDLPFSELDALYTHILSNVNDIERVLDVISFHILFQDDELVTVDDIEHILNLAPGEIPILLCDLASIIGFQEDDTNRLRLKILHASLTDYLLDGSRSKEYFINFVKRSDNHATACFQFLSEFQGEGALFAAVRTLYFFSNNLLSLELTESLYQAIKGFSIPQTYSSLIKSNKAPFMDLNLAIQLMTRFFFPVFFKFLQKEDSARHLQLLRHHQSEVDLFFRESMKPSWSMTPISLVFALVAICRKLPLASLQSEFCLFDRPHFDDQALAIFQLQHFQWPHMRTYRVYLSIFLWDPTRSQEFCAGPKLFAQAAKHCLLYLCNHTAPAQKFPRRMSAKQCMRRKNTPWKWHRRVIREDIRGPYDTPWFWLQYPPYSVMKHYILHRKTNDLIYVHEDTLNYDDSSYDPVVIYRLESEKYHLALNYLNYFLPRAAKLDSLVDMCQKMRLASRSQDFPRKSARACSNMQKYAMQWG